ncbi:hypothetical protein BGX29_002631, partial [Mortierella sp. GBA35]
MGNPGVGKSDHCNTHGEDYARWHSQGPTAAANTIQAIHYPRLPPAFDKDGVPLETSVIFVGNPGVGKSALLNALGGNFPSGCSEVSGLTKDVTIQLVTTDGRPLRLFDVPGIDDCVEEGEDNTIVRHLQMLQKELNRGGRFVIFFVFTPRNGRIEPSDYLIMKTVLDSLVKAPMVGLILTQVKKKHLAQLRTPDYGFDVWESLASIVESKEFVSMRSPLILAEHEEGFSEDEKLAILNYVLSFEPKPVEARSIIDMVVRRYFEIMKL